MEKRFLASVGYGFVAIAMLAIAVCLIRTAADIVDAHQKGGDLATWIGAIFTGLAFAGTIWIANSNERRRRHELEELADVMAASFIERLNIGLSMLKHIDQYLSVPVFETKVFEVKHDMAIVYSDYCRKFLMDFPTWTNDELLAAAPLPQRASHHIAAAMGRVQGVRVMLDIAISNRIPEHSSAQKHMEGVVSSIGTAILSLEIATDVCIEKVSGLNLDIQTRFNQQE
jgi:hypothetical protein